jgi:CBS domain containing-hemolysin-like protein
VMTFLLILLGMVCLIALMAVTAMVPRRARFGRFELERRKKQSDNSSKLEMLREQTYNDIVSVQLAVQAMLLVVLVLIAGGLFGWITGALIGIIIALGYGAVAGSRLVQQASEAIYGRYEPKLLEFIPRYERYLRFIRRAPQPVQHERLESRDHLTHLLNESSGIVTTDEKKTILSSLAFIDKQVADIMTPKSVIDTVRRTEILGPLVLDQLHKTGHSRFPVIDEDIDHIVGILYVRDILTLDTTNKHTATVESAMSMKVYYVRSDHKLAQVLSAFLSTHHHLFIVINEYRETVGIITLEDTLEALLGRRIVDEFDAHDDMRAVAARAASSPSALNRSAVGSTDI